MMKSHRLLLYGTLLMALGCGCAADEVMLKNGDRVSGAVVKLEGGKLAVTTEYAGTLQIDWDQVSEVRSNQDLAVQTEENALGASALIRDGSELRVLTEQGETVLVPATAVTAIRSESEQRAWEAAASPSLFQAWAGEVSLGFAFARGNSEVTNLSSGVNGIRQTLNDKVTFYSNSVYSTDRQLSAVVANTIRGGFRYDKDFSPGWFGFGSADFEFDDMQNVDLRGINGGGIGWHAIRAESATLDILGGTVWTREVYTFAPQRDFVAGKFGEEFSARLWPGSQLRQRGFYHPDLNDSSQYRVAVDLTLSSRINSWLSWQTSVSERYVSNPPIGSRRNDLLLTTGIGFRLGDATH